MVYLSLLTASLSILGKTFCSHALECWMQKKKKKKNADSTFSYFQWKTYVCLKLKIFKFQSNI